MYLILYLDMKDSHLLVQAPGERTQQHHTVLQFTTVNKHEGDQETDN